MEDQSTTPHEAPLRSLRSAEESVTLIHAEDTLPADLSNHILRIANAVDRALRRRLRDEPGVEIDVRLHALAPDEMQSAAVLQHLASTDAVGEELAARAGRLLELRHRLASGDPVESEDIALADDVYRGLIEEFEAPPRESDGGDADGPEPRRRRRGSEPVGWIALAAALGILLVLFFPRERAAIHMEQGVELFQRGEFADAAHHFWRYAEANPDEVTPQLYLARIHRRMGRTELAEEAIAQAEALDPDDAGVLRERGYLLLEAEQPREAVDRFRASLERDEDSAEAWIGLVRALRESGQPNAAEQALVTAPDTVRTLLRSEDS